MSFVHPKKKCNHSWEKKGKYRMFMVKTNHMGMFGHKAHTIGSEGAITHCLQAYSFEERNLECISFIE